MNNKSAFTLLEVMVALSLLLVIITLVISHASYSKHPLVACSAQKLIVTCRYAQLCALVNKMSHVVSFDIKAGTYSYNNQIEKLPDCVQFNYIDGAKGPPSAPTHLLRSAITFKNNEIIFYPDGIISPGAVYLTSKDKQIMYAISSPVAQSSSLHVHLYDGSWHSRS